MKYIIRVYSYVECFKDILNTINFFVDQQLEGDKYPMDQYIQEFLKQKAGHLEISFSFRDKDMSEIEAAEKFQKIINIFIESLDHIIDTHVIKRSLSYDQGRDHSVLETKIPDILEYMDVLE